MINLIKKYLAKTILKYFGIISAYHQDHIYNNIRNKYNLDKKFKFNGDRILMYGDGNIFIGSKTYIGSNSSIAADKGYSVTIGKGCAISHNVRIYTNSYVADQDFSIEPRKMKYGNVVIGDYVWIGANVFIGCGITIGDNTIIGANSLIVKNVEPFTIVGGVPAKLIRKKNIECVS